MKSSPLSFQINGKKTIQFLFFSLLAGELLIVFLDIFISHHKWASIGALRRLVNITREDSIGTWFSSTQMLLCGVALYLNALTCNRSKSKPQRRQFYAWSTIAAFFTFMAIDDAVKFHERAGSIMKVLLNRGLESGDNHPLLDMFPSYPWQLLFGPFFAIMGLFIFYFLWKELKSSNLRFLFVTALSLYVIAVGLDFIEGMDHPYDNLSEIVGTSSKHIRHYSKAFEEFLEMLGTTFFLIVFLKKLFSTHKQWNIKIK